MGITFNPAALLNGNGIDVNSLVNQVLSKESGPIQVWQQQQSDLSTQAGLLLGINNNLTSLKTAIQALSDPLGALAAMSATSSNPSILTASAQSNAVAGTHQITVSNLATSGTVYSKPQASETSSFLPPGVTGGRIELQVGGPGGSVHELQITPGSNDTLDTLATYINQQGWGVQAAVVTDASGARLAISANATGSTGALAITGNVTTGVLTTGALPSADQSILPSGQGSGDIQLQIGGSGGTIQDIPITGGQNDTLNTLADYINQQSTQNNWGVTAQVVSGAGGYQLQLSTQTKGPAGDLAFTTNTTVLTTVPNPPTNLSFESPVGGTDATFTVDGVPFTSHTNTVSGIIPSVTLNLNSAAPQNTVQLTIGADSAQATQAVNAFVSAYNDITNTINQQFTVDSVSNAEGPLASNSALRSLQSSLLNDVTYSIGGNHGLVNLASLGIAMNNDGTLTVDNSKLSGALATDAGAFRNFFQSASPAGFATNFGKDLTNLTDTTSGVLNMELAQNRTEQQNLTNEIGDFQDRLRTQQSQLLIEFNQVNAALQAYPYLLAQVNAQLGSLSPTTSSSKSGG